MKFGKRLLYVGLQGSYLRGEATPESDIDIMLVLDEIHSKDLNVYRQILEELGEYNRACGFVCGKNELLNWFPEEICHVLHTTSDIYRLLNFLRNSIIILDQVLAKRGACPAIGRILERIFIFAFKKSW